MSAHVAAPSSSNSVVFVFDNLPDWQQLAAAAGAQGHEVAVLDGKGDGLRQMADSLHGRSGVQALHVLSHGQPGALRLGNAWVDADALAAAQQAPALARLAGALQPGADILLYGCHTGAGGTRGGTLWANWPPPPVPTLPRPTT